MSILFLTSKLDLYDKYIDENGNKIHTPHNFGNINKILDNLKKYIKKYDNFLYVASDENNYDLTDEYAKKTFQSFEMTLKFKNYAILDGRTKDNAKGLIDNADFILLAGGHVPTQNDFFIKIKLKELIKEVDTVICGISAGSMNCAENVYCPPELEGEALNPNFKKYLKGLDLTKLNIYPHYNEEKYTILDGLFLFDDVIFSDSYKTEILVLNDGSYVLVDDNTSTVYGESFVLKNGKLTKICSDKKSKQINLLKIESLKK